MHMLVRAAVAVVAALLGLGGFVAVQASTGSDDQPAKREDGLSVLTTADDEPSPDDSPDDSPDLPDAVGSDSPDAVQDDLSGAVGDDPSTRTRTRTGRDNTAGTAGTADVQTAGTNTGGTNTGGTNTGGTNTGGTNTSTGGSDDRSGSNSGQG
ncbi:MAG TPA: hypothetical protein VF423_04820 [Actinomycetes bacterium]